MSAVLVTRAEPGAAETARRLIDRGHAPVIAPLLSIVTNTDARIGLDGVQAVLFTSANGARAFAHLSPRADMKALCVGDATALAARQAGFADVRSAEGDAQDMAAMIRSALDPRAGALLWASGADVSQDMAALLAPGGFDVRRAIVYRAEAAPLLPQAAADALRNDALEAVLFHSARAAQAFAALVSGAGLADRAARLAAACISGRVAEAASVLFWRRIEAARTPDEDSLLAALESGLGSSGA